MKHEFACIIHQVYRKPSSHPAAQYNSFYFVSGCSEESSSFIKPISILVLIFRVLLTLIVAKIGVEYLCNLEYSMHINRNIVSWVFYRKTAYNSWCLVSWQLSSFCHSFEYFRSCSFQIYEYLKISMCHKLRKFCRINLLIQLLFLCPLSL